MTFEKKREALQNALRPRVKGRVLASDKGSLTVECGGCTVDIPRDSVVAERRLSEESVELTLKEDAKLVVSMLVTPDRGFVADNVFGALVDGGIVSSNCNCNCSGGNCNCNCSSDMPILARELGSFRVPFDGGARAKGLAQR